jgi:DNA (cytosine-5)-methyltransferase 1
MQSSQCQPCGDEDLCSSCRVDRAFLQRKRVPSPSADAPVLRIADLFSGCGGMSAGLSEAARRARMKPQIVLALDSDNQVLDIFRANFESMNVESAAVDQLFDGVIGSAPSRNERKLVERVGDVDVLVGGPPCQGHSDLNNHTRRDDPKNGLYLRMARAAEVLHPRLVVVENVPPVKHDKAGVVGLTCNALQVAGYRVATSTIDLGDVGVPQRRRRFLLLASRIDSLEPGVVLATLARQWQYHEYRTVQWAVADLLDISAATPYDTPSEPTARNQRRIDFLFDNELFDLPDAQRPPCHSRGGHTYSSVYGRLRWDRPAQTITTGFGCIGQGRYIHPLRRRTLTPHEAARLQTFPDFFDFSKVTSRGVLAKAIGNAVPPLLMLKLGKLLLRDPMFLHGR